MAKQLLQFFRVEFSSILPLSFVFTLIPPKADAQERTPVQTGSEVEHPPWNIHGTFHGTNMEHLREVRQEMGGSQ